MRFEDQLEHVARMLSSGMTTCVVATRGVQPDERAEFEEDARRVARQWCARVTIEKDGETASATFERDGEARS